MRTTHSLSLRTAIPTALVALIACITIAAAGQDVVVKVPFDFQAGQAHFSAGEYVLSMDKVSSGAMVIRRAGASQGDQAIVLARKSTSPGYGTNPTVVFRSYGDSRFLVAVQSEGAARWELMPPTNEATLEVAQGNARVASLGAATSTKQ